MRRHTVKTQQQKQHDERTHEGNTRTEVPDITHRLDLLVSSNSGIWLYTPLLIHQMLASWSTPLPSTKTCDTEYRSGRESWNELRTRRASCSSSSRQTRSVLLYSMTWEGGVPSGHPCSRRELPERFETGHTTGGRLGHHRAPRRYGGAGLSNICKI